MPCSALPSPLIQPPHISRARGKPQKNSLPGSETFQHNPARENGKAANAWWKGGCKCPLRRRTGAYSPQTMGAERAPVTRTCQNVRPDGGRGPRTDVSNSKNQKKSNRSKLNERKRLLLYLINTF